MVDRRRSDDLTLQIEGSSVSLAWSEKTITFSMDECQIGAEMSEMLTPEG